jgi:hypothetical protein
MNYEKPEINVLTSAINAVRQSCPNKEGQLKDNEGECGGSNPKSGNGAYEADE